MAANEVSNDNQLCGEIVASIGMICELLSVVKLKTRKILCGSHKENKFGCYFISKSVIIVGCFTENWKKPRCFNGNQFLEKN